MLTYLPDKDIKVTIIKMLTEHERRVDEHSENFKKENKNNQSEPKNKITDVKKSKSPRWNTQQVRECRKTSEIWKIKYQKFPN